MNFDQLGLEAGLLRAIAAQGYTTPTPVQAKAIPLVLAGRDVLAGAQTGTGKTAAFTLPLLQLLAGRAPREGARRGAPRALVLTPTRELAAQVGESVRTYGANAGLRSAIVFGGVNINPQKDRLRRGVDILVATPGRLLDHAGQKTVDLSAVEILVLDEADRMLDMGFIHDIRKVLAMLPAKRQNLLFSATYTPEIRTLADRLLDRPEHVEVARRNAPAEAVTQHAYRVPKARKRDLLVHLVTDGAWHQVLVFMRTKHGANRLARQLHASGLEAAAIHGNKSQNARTQALAGFKRGEVRVLVATDIAARGLDIDGLPHVVNYELPNVPEDYVHRIGRTGRAGESGAAVSLVDEDEVGYLRGIERLLKRSVEILALPSFAATPAGPAGDDRPGRAPQSRHRGGAKPAREDGAPTRKRRPRKRTRKVPGAAR